MPNRHDFDAWTNAIYRRKTTPEDNCGTLETHPSLAVASNPLGERGRDHHDDRQRLADL
jgi:hypothetical protein